MQAVSVGVEGTYGMRLELYLIGDNVVASTAQSYPADGNLPPSEPPIIYYAVGKADGSLSLQDYRSRPIFDGFTRKTTVGNEGSAPWGYGASADGHDARSLTYKLTEIEKMNQVVTKPTRADGSRDRPRRCPAGCSKRSRPSSAAWSLAG